MKINGLFNKTKYFTLSITPIDNFVCSGVELLGNHIVGANGDDDMLLTEHMTYVVRKGCIVKLIGCIKDNTSDLILVSGEKLSVKPYTGYDIYGQDYVLYRGKEYLLRWNSKVLKLLKECSLHVS